MAEPGSDPPAVRPLDPVALRRLRRRLESAATPPWLHAEVARRMAERIAWVRKAPVSVLDWWSRLGGGREALRAACAGARIVEVEAELPAPEAAAGRWWSPVRWGRAAVRPLAEAAVEPGAADLVWSNMGLHLCADPSQALARWHRALAVGGFVMFSTLGPGSLGELRSIYRRRGWGEPFAPFVDMHDLGDMLVQAGFADPVMDQETLALNWPDAAALLGELRSLGGNLAPDRPPGLRTPRWRQALMEALGAPGARPALSFEVVYGHAFRAPPRVKVAGHTELPLDQMRAMVRAGRRGA